MIPLESKYAVEHAIVTTTLPEAYECINELLKVAGKDAPKELTVRCRRLLPRQYDQSFERGKR